MTDEKKVATEKKAEQTTEKKIRKKKAEKSEVKPETKTEAKIETTAVHHAHQEAKTEEKVAVPTTPAVAAEAAKAPAKAKKKSKKKESFVARGKRKESVARASIKKGSGKIRINNLSLEAYSPNRYAREIAKEAVRYMGPEVNSVDIHVSVYGGGMMGQAQAVRTAIANALVSYFDSQNLKDKFLEIDRSLLVEDVRRVESKKFKGPKARARFQKSYR